MGAFEYTTAPTVTAPANYVLGGTDVIQITFSESIQADTLDITLTGIFSAITPTWQAGSNNTVLLIAPSPNWPNGSLTGDITIGTGTKSLGGEAINASITRTYTSPAGS